MERFNDVLSKPKPYPIPSRYPSWASWSSREVYLPADLHSSSAFRKVLHIAKEDLSDVTLVTSGKIDGPLLLLGLLYREVRRVIEAKPGDDSGVPSHIFNSPLGVKELDEIEGFLEEVSIALPSDL